jgi:hypothetical protein
MAELRRLIPGGPGGEEPLLCHNSQGVSNVQEETLICARDQVIIARPPVGCRRPHGVIGALSLVSKGRFAVSINVICAGIRSGPPKR